MVLELRDVFIGGKELPIDTDLAMTDFDVNGENPISNLHFRGSVANSADVVALKGVATFTYSALCDRCAEPTTRDYSYNINHIIVNELSNEQDADEDFVVVDNMQLDLGELIRSDVILDLPVKFLCNPDCKGICVGCGKRLNFEECVCKVEIDPRLAKLAEFFDDDE